MGRSADEIDRQIRETRDRIDENIEVLEERATSSAIRYGRIAGVVLGALAAGGVAYLIYRRYRRPTWKDRLAALSPDSLHALADDLATRLKDAKRAMPSVSVTVNGDRETEPGALESIIRKVGPGLVGTASTALIERMTRGGGTGEEDQTAARHAAPAFD
ncbi:MAG TPA: hypothetical protein VGG31_07505 [Candidatus Dormibacteraeota bacterium]|jgi:hypothetical protein